MASAAIGVATANLYPQINLSAQSVLEALTPTSLAKNPIGEWALAAGLTEPLLDGGKLSAERRAAIDDYQASLADYEQIVLGAFREIADQLQALANDADRIVADTEAARTAADSLTLARQSFEAGNSGILDVIDAERKSAESRIRGFRAPRRSALMDTVQLYVALGGVPIPAEPPKNGPTDKSCCTY